MMTKVFSSVLCLSLLACNGRESTTAPRSDAATTAPAPPPIVAAQAKVRPEAEVDVASIYDLRVALRDETGKPRGLDAFRGHPVLITMFYGTCPVACPLLMSDLKRLERQIPEPLRSEVRVLMVSFDAEHDTPTLLTRLKQERGLHETRWLLASAGEDESRELAGVLNIKYRKLDSGAFFHSSVIVLLDRQGRPQARIDGADKDFTPVLRALSTPET